MQKVLKQCCICSRESIIWKSHEGLKYCQQCWKRRCAHTSVSVKPTKQYKIPRVSKKRQRKDRVYSKLRKEFLLNNPVCQIQFKGCTYESTEVHHTYAGSEREQYYLDTNTWKATCRNCHNIIHNNPLIAKQLNLIK